MALTAIAINCTLKRGSEPSSTDRLLQEVMSKLSEHDVGGHIIRAVDHEIAPGVSSDEGDGDEWPGIREQILKADILVLGTPIWLGQPSSVCKRVMERMDAFLSETDSDGRMVSYGTVAIAAVVGNEDGAHHVSAEIYQGLNDVGFSLAPNAVTYWVGEAMGSVDYKDHDEPPEAVDSATGMAVRNAVHLAGLLKKSRYPGS